MKKELKFIPIYKGEFNTTKSIESPNFLYHKEEKEEEFKLPLTSSFIEIAILLITTSYLVFSII